MKVLFSAKNWLYLFFGLQFAGLVIGRCTNVKFFAWAPYDELSYYEVSVSQGGEPLSAEEIKERYRRSAVGRENRTIHNLIAIIRQYETTYGRADSAQVLIDFNIHGRRPAKWSWPADSLHWE